MSKITRRVVDKLAPDDNRDQFVWDSELRGFGVRAKRKSGTASYLINYRTSDGRQRRFAFAKTGTLTPDEARKIARNLLAAVANGRDPSAERHEARATSTVANLCDQYIQAADAGLVITRFGQPKRASTIQIDKGRIARHINPSLGRVPVSKLARADVQRMCDAITQGKTAGVFKTQSRGKAVVSGGAGTAARVVELFGGMWTWAEARGLVSGTNPAHGVRRVARGTRERIMSANELAALGRTLDQQKLVQSAAAAAIRLMAYTGLRHSEACGLRWSEIDFVGQCFHLTNTKTGRSMRPLGRAAADLLRTLKLSNQSEWLFPNRTGDGPFDLKKQISSLFDAAGMPDVRSQVIRRTFASTGAEEGYSDSTIGDIIGHARRGVTARHYIRRPDIVIISAADRISARMEASMRGDLNNQGVIPFNEQKYFAGCISPTEHSKLAAQSESAQ